jgi:hypothetical protein
VAVGRITINGGANVTAGVLDLESSLVRGDLNLFGSRGALSSALVAGAMTLQVGDTGTPSTATCDHVLDGDLVLRPPNCTGP